MLSNFFKTYTVKCPDGTKRTVYRNINDAFPLSLTDLESQIKTKLKVGDKVDSEINTGFISKINGLLYDLDSSNRNVMIEFRGIYMVYKSDPCSNSEFLRILMQKIIEDHKCLKLLETRIQGLIEIVKINKLSEERFFDFYLDIIKDFGRYLPKETSKASINKARQNALKWQTKEKGECNEK